MTSRAFIVAVCALGDGLSTGGGVPGGRRPQTAVADGVYLFTTPVRGRRARRQLDRDRVARRRAGVRQQRDAGRGAAVLAEIRKLTKQPVRYVVNSHWHWDHWYGAEVYHEAFPGLEIISHEKTRAFMVGPAVAFNQPGLDTQLPAYIQSLEKRPGGGRIGGARPRGPARTSTLVADDRFFLEQKRAARHVFPDVAVLGPAQPPSG